MPEVSQKVNGHDNMRRDSWFKMAADGTARTSKAAEGSQHDQRQGFLRNEI
jgi:hypothetical protein